jgi:hypothetical protein
LLPQHIEQRKAWGERIDAYREGCTPGLSSGCASKTDLSAVCGDGCVPYREQPQFEFLELPNPCTSKLWAQEQQSCDGSDPATTTPPAGERNATKAQRHARASDQARAHLPRPHDVNTLLSVESAVLQAGIQVRISRPR